MEKEFSVNRPDDEHIVSPTQKFRRRCNEVAGDRMIVSIIDAGRILGLTRVSAYRAANAGRLPTIRTHGKRRMVSINALARYAGYDE